MERNDREPKRRTGVASLFVSESSILRLVSALLMEQDEAWIGEKIYLDLSEVPLFLMQFYRKLLKLFKKKGPFR